MNIAQYTETSFPVIDGVGRVVEAYAKTLTKKGHNCFIAAPKPRGISDAGSLPFQFVPFIGIPVLNTPYKLGLPFIDITFNLEVDRQSMDIVHVHDPFTAGAAGAYAAKHRCIPLVGTFHSKFYDDFYQVTHMKTVSEIGVKIIVDFYRKCDEVWAVSKSTADTLREYGYDGDIIVMGNGTDPKEANENDIRRTRESYGLNHVPHVILFAGQMNWKKNQRLVIESCAELKKMRTDFTVVFAGQGPDMEAIKKKAVEAGLGGYSCFCGHIEDKHILDALYCIADFLFFPSYYDNAPMVVREAAAAGTPSILARGSNAADAVTDGVNGLLCDDDPKQNAMLISRFFDDADALKKIGESAKETLAVSWDQIVDTALRRYEYLIERNRAKMMTLSGARWQ